jgi:AraC family transcriptional regulator
MMFRSSTAYDADVLPAPSRDVPPRLPDRAQVERVRDPLVGNNSIPYEGTSPCVDVTPRDAVSRRAFGTTGFFAEVIRTHGVERVEYRFRERFHLLVCGGGIRADGESRVEGLASSSVRDLRRKLTFVPAGREYYERHVQQRSTLTLYFYFEPANLNGRFSGAEAALGSRLHFEDFALWTTVTKLRSLLERPSDEEHDYIDALFNVLKTEVIRHNQGGPKLQPHVAGGLAAWQQRLVSNHIEAHLSQQLPVASLASLVRLSPYYFCRAFKESFGVPPHRYHAIRRVERAKQLLSDPSLSVTEIGMMLGFSETASFSASFRKIAGLSPSQYQRSFG